MADGAGPPAARRIRGFDRVGQILGKSLDEIDTRRRWPAGTAYEVAHRGTRNSCADFIDEVLFALAQPVVMSAECPSGETSHSFTTRFASAPSSMATYMVASGEPVISIASCSGSPVKVIDRRSSGPWSNGAPRPVPVGSHNPAMTPIVGSPT